MKTCLRLLLIFVLLIAVAVSLLYWDVMSDIKRKSDLRMLRQIGESCAAYAKAHEGNYPDGTTSNEAFRQLFIAGLIDDERLFMTSEIDRKRPDGNIGTAENGYLQALAPGECRWTYVRGLKAGKADPTTPLFYMQSFRDDGEVWMLSCREGGNSVIDHTENGAVFEVFNGQKMDTFSAAYLKERYGIAPQDILKPEGPPRDAVAVALARKWKIRLFQAGLIVGIIVLILPSFWPTRRENGKAPPETPVSEA